MVLDNEKARTFDCSTCDLALQVRRNCNNQYEESIIKLNETVYKQCPRSLITNQREYRFLVDMYFECKEQHRWPYPGSLMEQTAFAIELFDYIDGIVNTYRNRKLKEQEAQLKKSQNQANSKSKN